LTGLHAHAARGVLENEALAGNRERDDSLNSQPARKAIRFESRNGFDRRRCNRERIGRWRVDEPDEIEVGDTEGDATELAAEIHFGTASALDRNACVDEMGWNGLIVEGRNDGPEAAFGRHQAQCDVARHCLDTPHNTLHFNPTRIKLAIGQIFEVDRDWRGKIRRAQNRN
jgi:hypothetical protein